MTAKAGFRELHDSENRALTRFFSRTGWEPVYSDLPFDEMIRAEDDGEDAATLGEYEIRQRMAGARGFIRFLQARGPHPTQMLMQLADACRGMHIPPFNMMTMDEVAGLFGQGRAAVSFRGKVLSREIRLSGMRADKLPGQKSKAASASYQKREDDKMAARLNGKHRPVTRQKSFLRQLKVKPRRKHGTDGTNRTHDGTTGKKAA